ncbi:uncharacterized protein LOC109504723 [Harpegnathos saltator]|uniref:uncharacterized protein LOC109504723 n=1 Tax=Harpegnathos saltator TaxID=610380 RepID=UPI00094907B8|nr:uncharacterized protein LOC109504723 [Harpegnathos saltator]
MKFVIFTVLVIAAMVIAAPQERKVCSANQGYCQVYEDCCRHLVCQTYLARCVPKGGLIIPGEDKRPLSPDDS